MRTGLRAIVIALLVQLACHGAGPGSTYPIGRNAAIAPLPIAVTNNAVAVAAGDPTTTLYSALGLDASKLWSGITNRAFQLDVVRNRWHELPAVPGPGRIAATAQVVAGKLYLFGGYTVAADGNELSLPNVDIYDPATRQWTPGAPIPVAVDDAVSGRWRDSFIYLISGWHNTDNVTLVQVYDPARDRWQQATPVPGPGVFGHAGTIRGDTIVYIDGVRRNASRPRYTLVQQAWRGDIDPGEPTRIRWQRLPTHPGPALYRAAAGACGDLVVFVGGSNNPYNYNGIGYNGVPSAPSARAFDYDMARGDWNQIDSAPVATMDHRGLAMLPPRAMLVGGMRAGQHVSDGVVAVDIAACAHAS